MDPFARDADGGSLATDEQLELATVGALLLNELISDSRGLVERPMTIQFLSGGPKVTPHALEEPELRVKPRSEGPE